MKQDNGDMEPATSGVAHPDQETKSCLENRRGSKNGPYKPRSDKGKKRGPYKKREGKKKNTPNTKEGGAREEPTAHQTRPVRACAVPAGFCEGEEDYLEQEFVEEERR